MPFTSKTTTHNLQIPGTFSNLINGVSTWFFSSTSLSNEPSLYFYSDASQQNDFQQFQQWRTQFKTMLRELKKGLLPRDLNRLKNLQIRSPLYLEHCLAKFPITWQFDERFFAIQQAALKAQLKKKSHIAIDYFHTDIKHHLVLLAGNQLSPQDFLDSLQEYYQSLIPDYIYQPTINVLTHFIAQHFFEEDDVTFNQATRHDFETLIQHIDGIFAAKSPMTEPVETQQQDSPDNVTGRFSNVVQTATNNIQRGITYVSASVAYFATHWKSRQSYYQGTYTFTRNSFIRMMSSVMTFVVPINTQTTSSVPTSPLFLLPNNVYSSNAVDFCQDSLNNTNVLGGFQWNSTSTVQPFIMQLDSQGNAKWAYMFGSNATNTVDKVQNIYCAKDGSIVTTFNSVINSQSDIVLTKFNESGAIQWAKRIGGAGAQLACTGTFGSNNTLIIGGFSVGYSATGQDCLAMSINSDSGNINWVANIFGIQADFAYGVSVNSNRIFLTGYTESFGNQAGYGGIFTVELHSNGTYQGAYQLRGNPNFDEVGANVYLINNTLVQIGYSTQPFLHNVPPSLSNVYNVLAAGVNYNNGNYTLSWSKTLQYSYSNTIYTSQCISTDSGPAIFASGLIQGIGANPANNNGLTFIMDNNGTVQSSQIWTTQNSNNNIVASFYSNQSIQVLGMNNNAMPFIANFDSNNRLQSNCHTTNDLQIPWVPYNFILTQVSPTIQYLNFTGIDWPIIIQPINVTTTSWCSFSTTAEPITTNQITTNRMTTAFSNTTDLTTQNNFPATTDIMPPRLTSNDRSSSTPSSTIIGLSVAFSVFVLLAIIGFLFYIFYKKRSSAHSSEEGISLDNRSSSQQSPSSLRSSSPTRERTRTLDGIALFGEQINEAMRRTLKIFSQSNLSRMLTQEIPPILTDSTNQTSYVLVNGNFASEILDALGKQYGIQTTFNDEGAKKAQIRLGHGDGGRLYLTYRMQKNASNVWEGQFIAVKITESDPYRATKLQNAKKEAEMHAVISRFPGVIPQYYWVLEGEKLYQFMPFASMDGEVLRRCLMQLQSYPQGETLFTTLLVYWAAAAFTCLDYLHNKGYFHLDIKPANTVIENGLFKLIDFASMTREKTLDHDVHADTNYHSPEQMAVFRKNVGDNTAYHLTEPHAHGLRSQETADQFNSIDQDNWAIGVSAIELLSGYFPFLENTPTTTNAKLVDNVGKHELSIPLKLHKWDSSFFSKRIQQLPKPFYAALQTLLDILKQVIAIDPSQRISLSKALERLKQHYTVPKEDQAQRAFIELDATTNGLARTPSTHISKTQDENYHREENYQTPSAREQLQFEKDKDFYKTAQNGHMKITFEKQQDGNIGNIPPGTRTNNHLSTNHTNTAYTN